MRQIQGLSLREAYVLVNGPIGGMQKMTDGRRTTRLRESEKTIIERQRVEIMRLKSKVNSLQDFIKTDTKELDGDLMKRELV